jgi:hypothetical protein
LSAAGQASPCEEAHGEGDRAINIEDVIRDVALPTHLVDINVCSVDDIWSGLKLVVRKEHR